MGVEILPDTQTYELSLSPDYVSAWGFWEAVRELLQNSIDQCTVNRASKTVFDYDEANESLTIGTTNCRLEPRTLLLGVSGKRDDSRAIGQFGEGYKLALLVLTRLSYEVRIANGPTLWTPRFCHSDKYNEHVLTIDVEPREDTGPSGVHFTIRDVDPKTHERIHENYLMDVPVNTILEEDYLRGRVFVRGLFVCDFSELHYGYNFSPDRIKLDRDRGMASQWEVAYEASRLWCESGNVEALYECMATGALDTQHVNIPRQESNVYVVERYLRENPDCIPIASEADAKYYRGAKTRLVPKPLRDLLHRMHEFVFNHEGTPSERLEAWHNRYGSSLGAEAKRDWEKLLAESKQWA